MKNKLKLTGVIMIVVLFAVTSCNKNNQGEPASTFDNETYAKMIIQRIDGFREQMNSTYKSGELMPLDTAIWNLEALITYDEAYPDSVSRDFIIKTASFTLPVDQNNMVQDDDVQALYYDMLDTVDYQLAQFTETVKFLAFSDVELVEVVSGTAYIEATNGYGFNLLLGTYDPFDEDDDWYWGTLSEEYGQPPLGKCDGTEVGVSDGSNEIQYRLNNPIPQSPYSSFTDLETFVINGDDFLDNEDNPRLFWGWDYPNDECLTNDLLTYYLIQSDDIIHTTVANGGLRPEGKLFVSVYIDDDLAFKYGQSWHYHRYNVTYGIPAPDLPN